jgi:predicted ester cyclase
MSAAQATRPSNKDVVRRYIEDVINRRDLDLIDVLFAPDRREVVRAFHSEGNDPFPDGREEILDLVADGDTVMARWILRGTHRGSFFGYPATGRPVEMTGYGLYRLEGGQIADEDMLMDWESGLEQIGVTRRPPDGEPG